jgi:protein-S-isoprenylcysteine O-methyltransferase Ste14
MKATQFEFRFRLWIGVVIYLLGFWAPWARYGRGAASVTTTWLELSGQLTQTHALTLQSASVVVTVVAIVLAALGAAFRVWGTAYLGGSIVTSRAMHAQEVLAAGPYRHLRNPLYFGSFVFSLAVAILMPPTGAIFFVIVSFVLILRLILGEEAYMEAQQGERYREYKARVPRLFPSLVARVPGSAVSPQWVQAILTETYYVAMTLCFATLAWRYNADLLIRAVLICFGLSLVVRALVVKPIARPEQTN